MPAPGTQSSCNCCPCVTPSSTRDKVLPPGALDGSSRKRPIDLTESSDDEMPMTKKPSIYATPRTASKANALTPRRPKKYEEKRPRPFRSYPPNSYFDRYERARSQRMYVISRQRGTASVSAPSTPSTSPFQDSPPVEPYPTETIELAGSTGNIYTIRINRTPVCTCPDSSKGHQCKHIIYCLAIVLKAPQNLRYQLGFLSSELREIFSKAPAITGLDDGSDKENTEQDGKRKPIDGECPICFTELDDEEDVVWCKASCGQNIHKACFEQWAKSQAGRQARCVYCRADWQKDDDAVDNISKLKMGGEVNDEGYVNIGEELGLNPYRDDYYEYRSWRRGRRYGLY